MHFSTAVIAAFAASAMAFESDFSEQRVARDALPPGSPQAMAHYQRTHPRPNYQQTMEMLLKNAPLATRDPGPDALLQNLPAYVQSLNGGKPFTQAQVESLMTRVRGLQARDAEADAEAHESAASHIAEEEIFEQQAGMERREAAAPRPFRHRTSNGEWFRQQIRKQQLERSMKQGTTQPVQAREESEDDDELAE